MAAGQPAPAGPGPSTGRNLPAAIVTGVGLAILFLGSLFWHPLAFTVVIGSLIVVAALESSRVLAHAGYRVATAVLVISSLVTLGGTYRLDHQGQVIGVVTLMLGSIAWLLADARRTDVVRTLTITVFLGVWVGLGASFGVLLANQEDGVELVLVVVGAAIFTDIGGYAVGTMIGRHKVAPSVSPNKSWEGLVGGVGIAAGLGAVVLPALGDVFTAGEAALIAGLCGLAGFFGDLTESMIKRDLGIKDLGDLLPGHGGILDRVDGILLALPIGFFAIELIA